jgi:hypothetical protein
VVRPPLAWPALFVGVADNSDPYFGNFFFFFKKKRKKKKEKENNDFFDKYFLKLYFEQNMVQYFLSKKIDISVVT